MTNRPPDTEVEKKEEIEKKGTEKGKEADPAALPLKKNKKLILIIGGGIVLLAGGFGGIMFSAPSMVPPSLRVLGSKQAGSEEKKIVQEVGKVVQGHIYNMDSFIVNLADTDRSRFLKIRLNIESQEDKSNEEYDKRLPQLRDTILMVLTSKTSREIIDSEGKRKLREEVTSKLNQELTHFKVKTIYFTEFMIQ